MLLAVTLFSVIVPIVRYAVGCEELDSCYSVGLEELYKDINRFPGEEAFKKYCRPFLEYLTCRKNYYSRCPEPDPTGMNDSTYDDILELTSLLCQESSELRKSYTENVECYNEAFETVHQCVGNITALEMSFRKKAKNLLDGTGATSIAVTCMLLPYLKNCAVHGMEELCGKEESKSLDEIASRVVTIITDIQCPADEMKKWENPFHTFLEENGLQSIK